MDNDRPCSHSTLSSCCVVVILKNLASGPVQLHHTGIFLDFLRTPWAPEQFTFLRSFLLFFGIKPFLLIQCMLNHM